MPTVEEEKLIKSQQRRVKAYYTHKKFISTLRNSKEMKYKRLFVILMVKLLKNENFPELGELVRSVLNIGNIIRNLLEV